MRAPVQILPGPNCSFFTAGVFINNETLDHIPSIYCIVVMMHVVKGRQYCAYIVHASIAEVNLMESETNSQP
jgi:flagellar biosynthesis protein FliQ